MKLKHWIALFVMSFAGELAWGVQNQILNLFMYNRIVPRPILVSTMVFAGALVATVTAIVMGAYSDSRGKRKPFILSGYLLWGILVSLVTFSQYIHIVLLAVIAVILGNALISFFRATAYEGSFHAYLTDITDLNNRGTAQGIASLGLCFSLLLTFSGADIVAVYEQTTSGLIGLLKGYGMDSYTFYFVIIGLVVIIMGVIGGSIVQDSGVPVGGETRVLVRLKNTFQRGFFKQHRNYFLVLVSMALFMTAFNSFFSWVLIYLQHYLKLPADQVTILVLICIVVGGIIFSIPAGIICDKIGRKKLAIAAIIIESIFLIMFSVSKNPIWVCFSGCFWVGGQTAWMVATYAWSKDLYPEEKRAEFSGYMTIFQIGIGGGLGAALGGVIAELNGIHAVINGTEGIIPGPSLFMWAAILVLIPLIPVLMAKEKDKLDVTTPQSLNKSM
ncbi:MAG: MFS transporter [Chitinophagales bacterium]